MTITNTLPRLARLSFSAVILITMTLFSASPAHAQSRYRTVQAPVVQAYAYPYGARVAPVQYARPVAYAYPAVARPVPAPLLQVMPASNYLVFNGRFAAAPAHLPLPVQYAVSAGNELQGKPYVRGGGHRSLNDSGYDCSGSVSYTLIKAGLLNRPLSSKEFRSYGEAGPGRFITIYVKPGEHVFMSICGLRFDTTGGGEGQGPRWRPTARSMEGFEMRHPFGL